MDSTDRVNNGKDMETEGVASLLPVPPLPAQYVKTKDRTKARKTTDQETENNLASSAAPLEGDRRAQ
jgi:hypothetical protein